MLIEVIKSIDPKYALEKIAGIVFRNGNKIQRTASRPPISLNTLPLPARSLLPLSRYKALGLPSSMT